MVLLRRYRKKSAQNASDSAIRLLLLFACLVSSRNDKCGRRGARRPSTRESWAKRTALGSIVYKKGGKNEVAISSLLAAGLYIIIKKSRKKTGHQKERGNLLCPALQKTCAYGPVRKNFPTLVCYVTTRISQGWISLLLLARRLMPAS